MGVSFTRFSAVVVVALQWIAAIFLMLTGDKYQNIIKDFNATLPSMAVLALQAVKPMVLVPIAVITTAGVVLAEVLLTSAASRIVIQIGVFLFWLAFSGICYFAIILPLFSLIEKLR